MERYVSNVMHEQLCCVFRLLPATHGVSVGLACIHFDGCMAGHTSTRNGWEVNVHVYCQVPPASNVDLHLHYTCKPGLYMACYAPEDWDTCSGSDTSAGPG